MSSRRSRIFSFAFVVLISGSAAISQTLTRDQKVILELQDSRSLGDGKLVSYLQSKDKDLRYRAAIALGNLQDTSTVSALAPLLQDVDVQIRSAAAFALGQIGSASAVSYLITALTPEQDVQVLPQVFEAIGKCGNSEALNSVVAFIPSAKNIAVKQDQALSIARFAIRKITSERGVWLCFDLLKDNHWETCSAALYALWRAAPLGVIDVEISNRAYLLVKLMSEKEAEVRINLATLLGKTKSEEAPRLIKMFQQVESQTPDWRVQVQLARSCGLLSGSDPSLLDILLAYLKSPNDHVRITTLTTLASLDTAVVSASEDREKILTDVKHLALTPSKEAPLVQGEAMVTLSRIFPTEFAEMSGSLIKKGADNLLRAKYIEALSYIPTEPNLHYVMTCLTDDSVRVAMAAWDFLQNMIQPRALRGHLTDSSFIDSIPGVVMSSMTSALNRNDFAISTLVATVFSDSSVFDTFKRAGFARMIIDGLSSAYSALSSSSDAEAMLAIQQTLMRIGDTAVVPIVSKSLADSNRDVARGAARVLAKITGRSYDVGILKSQPNVRPETDWKLLESIKPNQRVVFRTTKGTFTMRLRKDDAPFTVLAFFKLVKQKFYNGLTFHRVVPDFVIQGGDPRGDGWGGPGFTIRSEWSLANFERGSVGMASSGKDTEGCQFFITHIPTPHLDGRYTLFATVSTGMEVVDKIQVGDKILSAELR